MATNILEAELEALRYLKSITKKKEVLELLDREIEKIVGDIT